MEHGHLCIDQHEELLQMIEPTKGQQQVQPWQVLNVWCVSLSQTIARQPSKWKGHSTLIKSCLIKFFCHHYVWSTMWPYIGMNDATDVQQQGQDMSGHGSLDICPMFGAHDSSDFLKDDNREIHCMLPWSFDFLCMSAFIHRVQYTNESHWICQKSKPQLDSDNQSPNICNCKPCLGAIWPHNTFVSKTPRHAFHSSNNHLIFFLNLERSAVLDFGLSGSGWTCAASCWKAMSWGIGQTPWYSTTKMAIYHGSWNATSTQPFSWIEIPMAAKIGTEHSSHSKEENVPISKHQSFKGKSCMTDQWTKHHTMMGLEGHHFWDAIHHLAGSAFSSIQQAHRSRDGKITNFDF